MVWVLGEDSGCNGALGKIEDVIWLPSRVDDVIWEPRRIENLSRPINWI